MSKENLIKSKRFVMRKSLIGKNQLIEFTNKKGDVFKYNHDKVFAIMQEGLEKLACWAKYKSYTATSNIPTILRGKELVQQLVGGRKVVVRFDSSPTTKYKIMSITNKITGRDITTEYLALMSGLITNDEFELITLTLKQIWVKEILK